MANQHRDLPNQLAAVLNDLPQGYTDMTIQVAALMDRAVDAANREIEARETSQEEVAGCIIELDDRDDEMTERIIELEKAVDEQAKLAQDKEKSMKDEIERLEKSIVLLIGDDKMKGATSEAGLIAHTNESPDVHGDNSSASPTVDQKDASLVSGNGTSIGRCVKREGKPNDLGGGREVEQQLVGCNKLPDSVSNSAIIDLTEASPLDQTPSIMVPEREALHLTKCREMDQLPRSRVCLQHSSKY